MEFLLIFFFDWLGDYNAVNEPFWNTLNNYRIKLIHLDVNYVDAFCDEIDANDRSIRFF